MVHSLFVCCSIGAEMLGRATDDTVTAADDVSDDDDNDDSVDHSASAVSGTAANQQSPFTQHMYVTYYLTAMNLKYHL